MSLFKLPVRRKSHDDDAAFPLWVNLFEAEMRNMMQEFDQLKANFALLVTAQANLKTRLDTHAANTPAAADVVALDTDVKTLTTAVDATAPVPAP